MNDKQPLPRWMIGLAVLAALVLILPVGAGLRTAANDREFSAGYPAPEGGTATLPAYPPPGQTTAAGPIPTSFLPSDVPAVTPSLVAGQDHWPTPIPPDPTLLWMQIPACCDDANPVYLTPSAAQAELWTQSAPPPTPEGGWTIPTEELIPQVTFLPPSGEWALYTDLTYGYSLEYPENFKVVPAAETGLQTDVYNASVDGGGYYDPINENFFHVSIFVFDDKNRAESLETYASTHRGDPSAWILLDQDTVELAQSYSGVKQTVQYIGGEQVVTQIFIEYDGLIYVVFSKASIYDPIFDTMLGSLVLP